MLQPNFLIKAAEVVDSPAVTAAKEELARVMANASGAEITQGGITLMAMGILGVFTVLAMFIAMIVGLVKLFPYK